MGLKDESIFVVACLPGARDIGGGMREYISDTTWERAAISSKRRFIE